MNKPSLSEKVKQSLDRAKRSITDDCPAELLACEVCRKLDCDSQEWLTCEKRLATAQYAKAHETDPPPQAECSYEQGRK